MNQRPLFVDHTLEDEGVDDARTYAVVFKEDIELQDVRAHQGASSPKGGGRATVTGLRTGGLQFVGW